MPGNFYYHLCHGMTAGRQTKFFPQYLIFPSLLFHLTLPL